MATKCDRSIQVCSSQKAHSNRTPVEADLKLEPDLIQRFQHDVEQAGLVGEKANAAIVLLCAVSARLSSPLNLLVQGSSSAGKNHLLGRVAAFIPDEMKKFITGMSPKALMHSGKDEFKHKAVFIAEYEGVAGADFAIRTMQSERVIEWDFVESSQKGIRKKKNYVNGPAAFIEATTRPMVHPENETRLLFVEMDESSDLTRAILRRQAVEAETGTQRTPEALYRAWWQLIASLTSTQVMVPFAQHLAERFPGEHVRSRRDFPKLLGLIQASAFLHQHHRRKVEGRIIADKQDYRTARDLFQSSYCVGPDKAVAELMTSAESLGSNGLDFSAADVTKETGWGKSKTYEVLGRAAELGCIGDGERYGHYRFIRNRRESSLNLPDDVPT